MARFLAGVFVKVIRNTPFLIQAALLFAVVGVLRLRLPPELIGTVSVALYTSAYMAEIVRGALRSVPARQREAADALGLRLACGSGRSSSRSSCPSPFRQAQTFSPR